MDELYTDEVREADNARSRELLASMGENRWLAAELMAIAFRTGVAVGRERNANAISLVLA